MQESTVQPETGHDAARSNTWAAVCLSLVRDDTIRSRTLVLLLACLILFIRRTDAFTNPQFWAEDGAIFFKEQYLYGWRAVFIPYASYLHTSLRLVALLADVVPYRWTPAVYNGATLLLTLAVIASIFSPRLKWNYKPLYALTIVLVPHGTGEVFMNLTNLQWILAIGLIVVLFKEPPSTQTGGIVWPWLADLGAVLLIGLTGPFIILLVPFFAWRLWRTLRFETKAREENGSQRVATNGGLQCAPSAYRGSLLAVAGLAAAIQLGCMRADPEIVIQDEPYTATSVSQVFGHKLLGSLFVRAKFVYRLPHEVLSGVGLAFLACLLWRAAGKREFVAMCLGLAALLMVAACKRQEPGDMTHIFGCHRYTYIPYVLITWSLLALLDERKKWQSAAVTVGLVMILASSVTSKFQFKMKDYNWPEQSQAIGKTDLDLRVNPGWTVHLPAPRPLDLPAAPQD